jgi:hypothetical protein
VHSERLAVIGTLAIWFGLLASSAAFAQVMEGELRVAVRDPGGRPVAAQITISSRNPQFQAQARAGADGSARLQRLPFGIYRLLVQHSGFQEHESLVEIRSAVPHEINVDLKLGVLALKVTVSEQAPLLDAAQPAQVMHVGREQLARALGATVGRSTVDVVTTMPGWLLEANAVLHPRGSEYDTQYVIDGMPVYDNRSISAAPAYENDEFEAVNVLTAGVPAEYGRRVGGVIALDTRRLARTGHGSEAAFQTGSFGNHAVTLSHQYRGDRTAASVGMQAARTDRYLDPPSLENFTNKGTAAGLNGRFERDLSDRDWLTLYVRSNRTNFLVPNDLAQQAAGQRQDRRSSETAGQVHYRHAFSSRTLGVLRGMVRDLSAELWSNPLSTPVHVDQDRGFREAAAMGSMAIETRRNAIKFGADVRVNHLRERFLLAPDESHDFDISFNGRARSTEASAFIQDGLRLGNFAANVGLRFDRYELLIQEAAVSPRIALSYYIPWADVLLRASYDRMFQPPPTENLLLSSAGAAIGIDEVEGVAPAPASRANFFEVGFRKAVADVFRLDVSHYWRRSSNYIDDDVFLNTGLSFPITFAAARIRGTEVRLEMPRWRRVASSISYSNMVGRARSPVTGGLFIRGGEAEELRDVVKEFPISQDQRNTVAAQVRVEPHSRVWFTLDTRYGSGLPVELEEDEDEEDGDDVSQPISQAILDRIDFERGRIRPNFTLNLSAGMRVWEHESRSATLQLDMRNATDRLNVINFSGLFSGTALAPGRQMSFQLRLRF